MDKLKAQSEKTTKICKGFIISSFQRNRLQDYNILKLTLSQIQLFQLKETRMLTKPTKNVSTFKFAMIFLRKLSLN